MRGTRIGRAKPERKENPETVLQRAVLDLLLRLPEVAWAKRINTGAGVVGHRDKKTGDVKHSRFMRFGFVGCSDAIGQLKTAYQGRFLAVEAKVRGKVPTDDQQAFLDAVNAAGGIGIWVDDAVQLIPRLRERLRAIGALPPVRVATGVPSTDAGAPASPASDALAGR